MRVTEVDVRNRSLFEQANDLTNMLAVTAPSSDLLWSIEKGFTRAPEASVLTFMRDCVRSAVSLRGHAVAVLIRRT